MASSSSRASRSGQKAAPSSTIPGADVGGAASGPEMVNVARRASRAISTFTLE